MCFHPRASAMSLTTLQSKCDPPSECMSLGSGYTLNQPSIRAFDTVAALAEFVGCSRVVREQSSTRMSNCVIPVAVRGISTKSMCIYSNAVSEYAIYHNGRGIHCPVRVLIQLRHFAQRARMVFASAVLVNLNTLKCLLNSSMVCAPDRCTRSP